MSMTFYVFFVIMNLFWENNNLPQLLYLHVKQRGNFTLHQKTPRLLLHAPLKSTDKRFIPATVQGKRSFQNVTLGG